MDQVDVGAQLVADAGRTMDELVASVQRVTDIIGEISTATGEQSAGINLVGGAVSRLDSMTQQNAAMVEQSASAAENLREQADRLSTVVRQFQLEPTAAVPA